MSRPRFDYMPALDGLRAIAIAAVVFYHADLPWMPGGFIGVEVFLVISGFLITSLLAREFLRDDTVDITDFWARRARRLLPAMWAVILSVVLYVAYVLPDELAGLRGDAIAALGYAANWVLIFDHKSYFEQAGRPSLLKHFWSLAIEQQFYLVWPGVFSMFMARIPRALSIFLLVLLAAASAAWMGMLFNPDADPSRLYFGTDTRASGLLLGAALALLLGARGMRARSAIASALLEVAGVISVAALVLACFVVDEYEPLLYQGGFFAIAVLTAVSIAAVTSPSSAFVGHALRAAPLRWLGVRSYSLYLWHFPIFMVSRPELDMPLTGWPAFAVRLGLALACAELSYRFIEAPVRDGALGRLWIYMTHDHGPLRWVLAGAWALSLAALSVEVGAAKAPSVEQSVEEAWVATPKPANVPDRSLEEPVIVNLGPESRPAAVQPPPAAPAATGKRGRKGKNAQAVPEPAPVEVAAVEPPKAPAEKPTRVLAIGDSVMLGAARHLRAPGTSMTIDAVVGRQASAAVDLVGQLKATGERPEVVVIHIGNNGTLREQQFETIVRLLADARNIVFVNTKVPRRWQDPNNEVLTQGARRHAPQVTLVDWRAYSEGHPEWFRSDGYHLQPAGAEAYAELLRPYYAQAKTEQPHTSGERSAL